MRVWVDLTNSPHVLVMRPLIEAMRADGHEVEVTARDFAQTLELCERFGIEHTPIGRHRGERLIPKFAGLVARSAALARWARGRAFDLAMGHGSNDVSVAAALLRIPAATAFDYEFAADAAPRELPALPGGRGARGDPPGAPRRYGATPGSCAATRASRRSTTSPTSSPTRRCSTASGSSARGRSWSCARRRRCRSTTASRIRSSGACSSGCAGARRRPSCCRGRATSARSSWRLGRVRRAGPRHRRAEPGCARRPGHLGRRHHEPRGRRPWDAGLHDLRGSARSGRREAPPGGSPEAPDRSRPGGLRAASGAQRLAGPSRPARTRHTPPLRHRTHEIAQLLSQRPSSGPGRHRRLPARARLLPRLRPALRLRHPAPLRGAPVGHAPADRGDEARHLRDVRALLEALALRRPEGLRVDPEGDDRRRPSG